MECKTTIMDKSVETFCKTNAFKLTIILLFIMKAHFSSVVYPLPPKQCCKRFVDVYLFPTLKKGEGEATFHDGREENSQLGKI